MKVLLDECLDQRLRLFFPEHECQSAAYSGFSGLTNGALLAAAEAAGFDVLITTDRSMPHQQNLSSCRIAIMILCAQTNRLEELKLLIPDATAALRQITAGAIVSIGN